MSKKKLLLLALMLGISVSAGVEASEPINGNDRGTWLGTVTLNDGKSLIVRDNQTWSSAYGAGLKANDRLMTGPGATLALAVNRGPAVTLSENCQVAIHESQNGLTINVIQGEVRVVHSGERKLDLISPDSCIHVDRSIVRFVRTGYNCVTELEAGSAQIATATTESLQLAVNEPCVIQENQIFRADKAPDWRINSSNIRLASAQQACAPLVLPCSPNQSPAGARGSSLVPYCDCLPMTPSASESTDPNVIPQPTDDATQPAQPPMADQAVPPSQQAPANVVQSSTSNNATSGTKSLTSSSFSGSSSLGLGAISNSTSFFSSGGLNQDANQQTFEGIVQPGTNFPMNSAFPGAIHLVTAETQYELSSVQLNAAELAQIGTQNFYSIGLGSPPTGQVVTDALTASAPVPTTLNLNNQGAHVVKLEQYDIPDPATPANGGLNNVLGISGLLNSPTGPAVSGTAPLIDERARQNALATFALGEFRVSTNGGQITFSIRRSDQDRLIIKDANGNDALDQVTPNVDVTFQDTVDGRFLPQSPTVKSPVSNLNALTSRGTTYSDLNTLRKAAITTIMADTLQGYSNRTGQTRFVVDGKIIDISGYRP